MLFLVIGRLTNDNQLLQLLTQHTKVVIIDKTEPDLQNQLFILRQDSLSKLLQTRLFVDETLVMSGQ